MYSDPFTQCIMMLFGMVKFPPSLSPNSSLPFSLPGGRRSDHRKHSVGGLFSSYNLGRVCRPHTSSMANAHMLHLPWRDLASVSDGQFLTVCAG